MSHKSCDMIHVDPSHARTAVRYTAQVHTHVCVALQQVIAGMIIWHMAARLAGNVLVTTCKVRGSCHHLCTARMPSMRRPGMLPTRSNAVVMSVSRSCSCDRPSLTALTSSPEAGTHSGCHLTRYLSCLHA